MDKSVQSFEYQSHQQIYNFIVLPANYMQVVLVNTNLRSCFSSIYEYEDFDSKIKEYFKNCRQIVNGIRSHKTLCLEFLANQLKVSFKKDCIKHEVNFQLEERKKKRKNSEELGTQLQNKLKQFCQENRDLSNEISKKDQRIQELEVDLRLSRCNFEAIDRQLKALEREFKQRSFHQRQSEQFVTHLPVKASYKVPLQSVDYNKQVEEKQTNNRLAFTPFHSEFLKNFKIEGQKIQMEKQYKNFYQVVFQNQIPITGKTLIGIKIIKTRLTNIYFGFMKESRRKEKFTCQHKQAVSYKLRGGKFLFEDGNQSGEEVPWIKEGDTLNLSIDRSTNELTWYIQDKFMLKRRLLPQMQKIPLYAFVSMQNEGDQIQFI